MTVSCYVCRKVITGYEHFNEVRRIFFCSFPLLMQIKYRHDLVSLSEQKARVNVYSGIKSRIGIRKRFVHLQFCLLLYSCCHQVEEAQKKAIAEYRKEHPEMGEDALQVELPKVTGEASDSRGQRRRGRRYERIEPLIPAQHLELDRHRRLHGAVQQRDPAAGIEPVLRLGDFFERVPPAPRIPEAQLPRSQQNPPRSVRAGQHLLVQEAPQQRGGDVPRHNEDNWVHLRRLAQQRRALAGKFAGNNLRGPHPAALPNDPTHPVPRLQGNRAGGVRMDPANRGRVDEWRRGIPGAEDGAVL